MSEVTYKEFVMSRAKPGIDIVNEMTAESAHALHMAVGISGEAGELLDAIKKSVIYGKKLDLENVKEEIGDLEFYITGLRTALGLTRGECIMANVAKLTKRYPNNYTNQDAQARADKQ